MKILLATNMFPNSYKPFSGIFIKSHVQLIKEKFGTDCIVITGDGSDNSFLSVFKKYLLFTIRIITTTLSKKFQLIHAHYTFPTGFISLISKWVSRKKMVLTVHGNDINAINKKNTFLFYLSKFTLHQSDQIIAVSLNLKRKIMEKFGIPESKITVIDMGFNPQIFHPVVKPKNEQNRPFTILFVGRLTPVKGVNILIKALSILKMKSIIKFKCNIIGVGEQKQIYEKMVRRKSLNGQVEFVGAKSQQEIAELMRGSDVVTIPSLEEGFGLVAIESFACGVPVIGSSTGGLKSLIIEGKNGYLFSPEDSQELSKKLKLLNQESKIKTDSCIASVSKYDMNLKVSEIYQLYNRMIIE